MVVRVAKDFQEFSIRRKGRDCGGGDGGSSGGGVVVLAPAAHVAPTIGTPPWDLPIHRERQKLRKIINR